MTPSNQAAASVAAARDIRDVVVSVIADVTRYPRDILLLEADLEEELGIDSVKRAEIFAVLRTRFELPETTEAAPIELRTVGNVISAVEYYLGAAAPPPAEAPAPAPPVRPASPVALEALPARPAPPRGIVDVIAETTRYPRELLVPAANLEEDLGFDGVQRSAIVAAIRRELGVPLGDGAATTARTIGDLMALATAPAGAAPPPIAPAPVAIAPARPQIHTAHSVAAKPFLGRVALVTGSGHGLGKTIAAV